MEMDHKQTYKFSMKYYMLKVRNMETARELDIRIIQILGILLERSSADKDTGKFCAI
jgi:hypothetical protein